MADERRVENLDAAAVLKPHNNDGLNDELSSNEDGKGSPAVSTPSGSSFVDSTLNDKGDSRSFTQFDSHHYSHVDGSHTVCFYSDIKVLRPESSSLVYYLPTYEPHAFGAHMGMDGQHFGQQQYFCSAGHLQQPVSYGSEALPCNSWGTTPSLSRNGNQGIGTAGPKLRGLPSEKASGDFSRQYSRPINQTQELYPLNKVPHYGSPLSAGPLKEHHAVRNFSTFTNQRQNVLIPQNGLTDNRPNGRIWNGKDTFACNPNRSGEFEMRTELTRGPRSSNKYASPELLAKKKELDFPIRREQYNQKDFVVEYEDAKFFIIKSYSEDDVHKSIKYGVWTSTPNGNKRLDAAFRDAEARASDKGTECPIFLFFSVNGSGQFVGVAEMIGMVDFNKDMNFWRVDKWNGFFPVRWHIIKDVPNSQLRHIILENNDNKSVTFTRDTHEVELKEGLEVLNIFKNYDAKLCLLDDFKFYESKEKALDGKKNVHSESSGKESYKNNLKPARSEEVDESGRVERGSNSASLINLTRNLSLRESSI